jgi:2,3-bisphosphoglycerate-independent phosphoglycerate mutase
MKYVLIVPDGMGDRPLKELRGKTPLETARTPNMDFLYRNGLCGTTNNTPRSLNPASDVANMSILGVDPLKTLLNRGPLEALAQGLQLKPGVIIFRMNFVTVRDGRMKDFTAGHISTKDATRLVGLLNRRIAARHQGRLRFYPGVSYRNLLIFESKRGLNVPSAVYTPPHDITDRKIASHLPPKKDIIRSIMDESAELLADRKLNPTQATMVWLYGQGPIRKLPSFRQRFGLSGALISAVDLVRGLGRAIGLDILKVPGITSYFDTNYANKGRYALAALKKHDFVFVHIEAPDEAGHEGNIREKIRAIENIDRHIVGPLLKGLAGRKFRMLILPDHRTPVCLKTHCHDDVPFLLYDSTCRLSPAGQERKKFSERHIDEGTPDIRFRRGSDLLPFFVRT